jgi:hypothetical protein
MRVQAQAAEQHRKPQPAQTVWSIGSIEWARREGEIGLSRGGRLRRLYPIKRPSARARQQSVLTLTLRFPQRDLPISGTRLSLCEESSPQHRCDRTLRWVRIHLLPLVPRRRNSPRACHVISRHSSTSSERHCPEKEEKVRIRLPPAASPQTLGPSMQRKAPVDDLQAHRISLKVATRDLGDTIGVRVRDNNRAKLRGSQFDAGSHLLSVIGRRSGQQPP